MATPVMVMGIKVGLRYDQPGKKDLPVFIIDEHDKIYTSSNINMQ